MSSSHKYSILSAYHIVLIKSILIHYLPQYGLLELCELKRHTHTHMYVYIYIYGPKYVVPLDT